MKKLMIAVIFCLVSSVLIAEEEFNSYEYSQKFRNWIFNDGYIYMLNEQLQPESLVSFAKEELRILRNCIYAQYGHKFSSPDLINFFSKFRWYRATENNVDNQLTEVNKRNIRFIQEIENNFPSGNGLDKKPIGIWRERGGLPDQGYTWGDYIILYPNGIFEYKFRNFNARRYNNQIYGGAKYGLWTTKEISKSSENGEIDFINIKEIHKLDIGIDETTIYNRLWWYISNNTNDELDWGAIR
jgi:hypothetical protein